MNDNSLKGNQANGNQYNVIGSFTQVNNNYYYPSYPYKLTTQETFLNKPYDSEKGIKLTDLPENKKKEKKMLIEIVGIKVTVVGIIVTGLGIIVTILGFVFIPKLLAKNTISNNKSEGNQTNTIINYNNVDPKK